MKSLALVMLCLAPQDEEVERQVARLVDRLSDDRVEAREKAAKELTALGTKALPSIRRRSETGDTEVRERLLAVAREIERLDRLRFFLGGESPITLKADRLPIGKLLAELARQNATPVVLDEVPDGEPVTVDLKDARFFDALRQICIAHGGLVMRIPGGTHTLESHAPVRLARGDPRASRPFVEGPFVVGLDSVYVSESSDFQGKRDASVSLYLGVGWERGTRPIGMKLRVNTVVDDQGTPYKVASSSTREKRMDIFVARSTWVKLDPAPPTAVASFKEIAGTAEFEFPSDGHVARVENPLGRKGVEAPGGPASFTLEEFVRDGDLVRATVEAAEAGRENWLERIRFFAIDGQDWIYPQEGGRGRSTTPGRMRWTFTFEIPDAVDVKELRAVKIKEEKGRTIQRKFEWKLENVRFR